MTSEELSERASRQPFKPFQVILTTGEKFNVRHPDLIMVGRRSVVIGIARDERQKVYDRSINVDLLHVVAVEEIPGAPSAAPEDKSNGEIQE